MARVRIRREEMNLIVDVADRMAKRMNARFVVDRDRVEVVDEEQSTDSNKSTKEPPLNT